MPMRKPTKRASRSPTPPQKVREVLDVGMTAQLLTVSTDTVYDLLKRGELPGRKVGRKWLTTRNAVLRWIESSSEHDSLARAIEGGDKTALTKALNSGKAKVR
jgi:excisionase family DNA binding protein